MEHNNEAATAAATEPTKGELIVRHQFNPSGCGNVNFFKETTARMINAVEEIKHYDPRLAAITITKLEEAALFAVKLATTDK